MSSAAAVQRRSHLLYGAAALLALFELGVFWLALNPDVSANYRAYYLDRTTTCLDQPVSGTYRLGTRQSFRSGAEVAIKPLRVCGWEGPAGNGLHAVGESSRLRFALGSNTGPLLLEIDLAAVQEAGARGQRVVVRANGTDVATLPVAGGEPQRFAIPLPASLVDGRETLELELLYPEALTLTDQQSPTRKRSIMLTSVLVRPASTDVQQTALPVPSRAL